MECGYYFSGIAGCRICLLLLLFLLSIYIIFRKNVTLKDISLNLHASENLFRTVFTQAPIGISVVKDYSQSIMINPRFEEILGRNIDELNALGWKNVTYPDDYQADQSQFTKFTAGEIDS